MPEEMPVGVCPRCREFALYGVTAAEVGTVLFYVCGFCEARVHPEEATAFQSAAQSKPKGLLARLKEAMK